MFRRNSKCRFIKRAKIGHIDVCGILQIKRNKCKHIRNIAINAQVQAVYTKEWGRSGMFVVFKVGVFSEKKCTW